MRLQRVRHDQVTEQPQHLTEDEDVIMMTIVGVILKKDKGEQCYLLIGKENEAGLCCSASARPGNPVGDLQGQDQSEGAGANVHLVITAQEGDSALCELSLPQR